MKRLFILALIFISFLPAQGGSNITHRAVSLNERIMLIRFINMGVDAYWGEHILENAAAALPILEDLIGIPLPRIIESVEIYGERTLGEEEWVIGYNNGEYVALLHGHPDPTTIMHEIVHFWTIHCSIPWPLEEGYCELYADLCATQLGLYEVALPYRLKNLREFNEIPIDWEIIYENLQKNTGRIILNSFDYHSPEATLDQISYFYLASTVMMYRLYEGVGEEGLKAINRHVEASEIDDRISGVGIIQYLKAAKEATGANYTAFFMPVLFTEWKEEQVEAFERNVSRYCALSVLTGFPDSDEQMNLALQALVKAKFADFESLRQGIIIEFYAQQMEKETELPEQEIIYPERETGLLHNRLFIAGVIMLVVVVISLIIILSKLAREEEEIFEWERPLASEPGWSPFEEKPAEEYAEDIKKLPELPDLEELTK